MLRMTPLLKGCESETGYPRRHDPRRPAFVSAQATVQPTTPALTMATSGAAGAALLLSGPTVIVSSTGAGGLARVVAAGAA
jgi:hypothetical protein